MRTLEQHLEAILATVRPPEPRRVPIGECLGLVLQEQVRSRVALPGFDNSAMDGYAVRAQDVAQADPETGAEVTLTLVGEVAAGGVADRAVGAGEAVRIMTGGMLPEGADAVVKVEDTDGATPADGTVVVRAAVTAGTSLRWTGEDVEADAVVLEAGTVLDARRIALLAATGHADALVLPRPGVAVVSTGAELVDPSKSLAPGQIHDSNSPMLAAAVEASGCRVAARLSVGDDPALVLETIDGLARDPSVDVVVTSGGVSMGAYDVVKESLRDHGVEFVQVAMQPGKPQGFGVVGPREVPVFALPGNPVSSYVSFEVFVRPALRMLMGVEPARRPAWRARLAAGMRSPKGRAQVARAMARYDDRSGPGGWVADPVWGQASHFVADLARANALLHIPADVTRLEQGEEVELWLLDDADASAAWAAAAGDPTTPVGPAGQAGSAGHAGGDVQPAVLTHVRKDGTAHMVDVSGKAVTSREASAQGRVLLSAQAVGALRTGNVPKGDALAVARIAGIQAVKRTPELIPLAHPIAVHAVEVDLTVEDDGVRIDASVRTADRTGIEMEALTAVSVAALALVDMVKAVDRHARIHDIRVTAKSGGRSGDWREPEQR